MPPNGSRAAACNWTNDELTKALELVPSALLSLSHQALVSPSGSPVIGEVRVRSAHVIGRATNRTLEQIADPLLKDAVRRKSNGVFDPFSLQIFVHLGIGEAGVGTKINARDFTLIPRHDRLQYCLRPPSDCRHRTYPGRRSTPDARSRIRHGPPSQSWPFPEPRAGPRSGLGLPGRSWPPVL